MNYATKVQLHLPGMTGTEFNACDTVVTIIQKGMLPASRFISNGWTFYFQAHSQPQIHECSQANH